MHRRVSASAYAKCLQFLSKVTLQEANANYCLLDIRHGPQDLVIKSLTFAFHFTYVFSIQMLLEIDNLSTSLSCNLLPSASLQWLNSDKQMRVPVPKQQESSSIIIAKVSNGVPIKPCKNLFIIPMQSLKQDFQRALNTIFSAFKAIALCPNWCSSLSEDDANHGWYLISVIP